MVVVNRTLTEGLNSAKYYYLDSGLIPLSIFDKIVKADPTPKKQYVEWMCEEYVRPNGINNLRLLANLIITFDRALKTHYDLPFKDILMYRDGKELQKALRGFKSYLNNTKNIKSPDVRKIYENSACKIYYVKSVRSCIYFSIGTEWELRKVTAEEWKKYNENFFFIFLVPKKSNDKIVFLIEVFPFIKYKSVDMVAFDKTDTKVDSATILNQYNLSLSQFDHILVKNVTRQEIKKAMELL